MILRSLFATTGAKLAVGGALVAVAAGGTAAAEGAQHPATHPAPTVQAAAHPFGQTVAQKALPFCKAQSQVSVGDCVSAFVAANNPGHTDTAAPVSPNAVPSAGKGNDAQNEQNETAENEQNDQNDQNEQAEPNEPAENDVDKHAEKDATDVEHSPEAAPVKPVKPTDSGTRGATESDSHSGHHGDSQGDSASSK